MLRSRSLLLLCATAAVVALSYFVAGPSGEVDELATSPSIGPENLPAELSNAEFWRMVTEFSEPGGYFRSDNFLSNEAGYQFVIPALKKTVPEGGLYLGVGPEQNFTYIAAFSPKMAFIVDIRRQNMLEHLLYKALMELSSDRAEFLSMLFSRPRPAGLKADSAPEVLFRAYEAAESKEQLFSNNLRRVLDHLERARGFKLSKEDERSIRYVYNAFFESGPDLSYVFLGSYGGRWGMPTYSELMTESDGAGRQWSFLAEEGPFRKVQQLQKNNLIVPLVGNFAGDKALRSVGTYMKDRNAVLTTLYASNVEQYLFQDNLWDRFYANVKEMPINSRSVFIRFVLNGRGYGLTGRLFSSRSRTMWSPIREVLAAFDSGQIQTYYDVVEMSR